MAARFRRSTTPDPTPVAADAPVAVKPPVPPPASPSEPVDTADHYWVRWRVQPPQGNPGDPWERQDCQQCAPRHHLSLLVESGGSRFYCVTCGWHGDASVDPPHYVGHKSPLDEIIWAPAPGDLESVLRQHGLDAEQVLNLVPDMVFTEGYFSPDSATPGWRPALRMPVREEVDGPVRDLLFVGLDEQGQMASCARLPRAKAFPWGWERVTGDQVLFVESPLDTLALWLSGQNHAVCLPHTLNPARPEGGDWSSLTYIESRLPRINRVELAFADDEAGHRLEEELSRRLGRDRTFRTRWESTPFDEDNAQPASAYRLFLAGGEEAVVAQLDSLTPYPIAGIHELDDVDAEYEHLYEVGLLPGLMVGYPSLDYHYSIKPGQITVVHGIPQHGKTTFIDDVMMQMAKRHHWGFGIFSAENSNLARHYAGLTEKYTGKPFTADKNGAKRLTVAEKNDAKKFLKKHFRMLRPDEEKGNWSLDGILDLARVLVFRYGIRGLVIDPWNELEHNRPPHLTVDEYLAHMVSKVRRFAEVNDVHVWLVVHPRTMDKEADGEYPVPTPYKLNGGAMWFNKADFIIAVWRRRGWPDECITDFHIQKVRLKEDGAIGMTSLWYDQDCNQFHDRVNHNQRKEFLSNRKGSMSVTSQLLAQDLPFTPLPTEEEKLYYRSVNALT